MDAFQRTVYRVFGVSDLLTPDHQRQAAAVALLRAAALPDTQIPSAMAAWLDVADAFVAVGTERLQLHAYDEAIGDLVSPPGQAVADAINNTASEGGMRAAAMGHGGERIPQNEARTLAGALVENIVQWARDHPDALTLSKEGIG